MKNELNIQKYTLSISPNANGLFAELSANQFDYTSVNSVAVKDTISGESTLPLVNHHAVFANIQREILVRPLNNRRSVQSMRIIYSERKPID